MHTITNSRTGETVQTPYEPAELATRFAAITGGAHWAFYWMARVVMDAATACPVAVQTMRQMIGFISDSFVLAVGRGLKKPMIRLGFKEVNRRYKVYLSKAGTPCIKGGDTAPGSSDPVGDEEYIGCLCFGKFLPNKNRPMLASDTLFIDRLSADPVGFFVQCSKDMDRCCYCNLPLEDARSKEAGYGEVCANRWGLPWGKGRTEEIPSFASLWGRADSQGQKDIRGICAAIRKTPGDDVNWLVLRDALTDAGWPENRLPSKPAGSVIVPRE